MLSSRAMTEESVRPNLKPSKIKNGFEMSKPSDWWDEFQLKLRSGVFEKFQSQTHFIKTSAPPILDYQRCADELHDAIDSFRTENYRNDRIFVTIWLAYLEALYETTRDQDTIKGYFKLLKSERVGLNCPEFYIRYAHFELTACGKSEKALSILKNAPSSITDISATIQQLHDTGSISIEPILMRKYSPSPLRLENHDLNKILEVVTPPSSTDFSNKISKAGPPPALPESMLHPQSIINIPSTPFDPENHQHFNWNENIMSSVNPPSSDCKIRGLGTFGPSASCGNSLSIPMSKTFVSIDETDNLEKSNATKKSSKFLPSLNQSDSNSRLHIGAPDSNNSFSPKSSKNDTKNSSNNFIDESLQNSNLEFQNQLFKKVSQIPNHLVHLYPQKTTDSQVQVPTVTNLSAENHQQQAVDDNICSQRPSESFCLDVKSRGSLRTVNENVPVQRIAFPIHESIKSYQVLGNVSKQVGSNSRINDAEHAGGEFNASRPPRNHANISNLRRPDDFNLSVYHPVARANFHQHGEMWPMANKLNIENEEVSMEIDTCVSRTLVGDSLHQFHVYNKSQLSNAPSGVGVFINKIGGKAYFENVESKIRPSNQSLMNSSGLSAQSPFLYEHESNRTMKIRRQYENGNPQSYCASNSDTFADMTSNGQQGSSRHQRAVKVNGRVYKIIQLIGRGGSSKVLKVIGPGEKVFALKRVGIKNIENPTIQGYLNEINLLQSFAEKHAACKTDYNRHVIHMYDYEINHRAGFLYMILEYGEVDLGRLLKVRRANGGPDIQFIRFMWYQMLHAVLAVHNAKIVHCDLKPVNFLIVEGVLKIIDFGISKKILNDTTNIVRDIQMGTVNYMSPEALQGTRDPKDFKSSNADCSVENQGISEDSIVEGRKLAESRQEPKICEMNSSIHDSSGPTRSHPQATKFKQSRSSDVWSLGCIFYEMVYGHAPFARFDVWQRLRNISDPNYQIEYEKVPIPGWETVVLDILKSCLQYHAKRRVSIEELIAHPFLRPPTLNPGPAPPTANMNIAYLIGSERSVVTKEQLVHLVKQLRSRRDDLGEEDVPEFCEQIFHNWRCANL